MTGLEYNGRLLDSILFHSKNTKEMIRMGVWGNNSHNHYYYLVIID